MTRAWGLVLLSALGGLLRCRDLWSPWVGGHTAWGGAMYGNIARNIAMRGFVETGFGPVANYGAATVDGLSYYYHYPPLLVWLVALSFKAFGVVEWAARLVPLAFSIAAIPLTFQLATLVARDVRVAWLATLAAAVMPMGVVYGTHVDVYGPLATTSTLAAFVAYGHWLTARRSQALGWMALALVVGCLTAWYAYFAVAVIAVYDWWLAPARLRMPRVSSLGLAAIPFAVFGLFLLHRTALAVDAQSEVYSTLWEKLVMRSSYLQAPVPLWRLGADHLVDAVKLHTPLVALGAVAWLIGVVRHWRVERTVGEALLLLVLAHGVAHNLAFPLLLPGHDFMAGAYTAFLAVSSAVVTVAALDGVGQRWRTVAPTATVIAAVALVGLSTALTTFTRRYGAEADLDARRLGLAVREASRPEDHVAMPIAENRVLQYYAEREMAFGVDSPAALAALPPARSRVYAARPAWVAQHPGMAAHLAEQAAERLPQREAVLLTVRLRPSP